MLNLLNMRLDLFDGGSAGAGAGTGASGATSGSTLNAAAGSPSADATKAGVNAKRDGGGHLIAEGSSVAGNDANTSADVNNKTSAPPKSREERRRAYDDFIKGEGKEFFAEDTQNIVSRRLKEEKALKEQVGKLTPFVEAIADKYGLDPTDLEGLSKAIQGDRDFYAEAAAEAGMDNPETYRQFREAQRKTKALEAQQKAQRDAQLAQEEAQRRQNFVDQKMKAWRTEAEAVKSKYPEFDFERDSSDPQFLKMLRAGVPVEVAYQAHHHRDILQSAVNAAKAETEKAVVDNIRARGNRPVEGGANAVSAPQTGYDVRNLTREQRAEIAKQAAWGKRIDFK